MLPAPMVMGVDSGLAVEMWPVTEFAQQGQNAVAGGKAGRDQGDRAVAGTGGDALADLLESARVTAGLLRRFGRLRCARTKRSVRPFIRA